ncbi:MAG: phosphoribosylglycinamide formyltransferase [Bacteroidales bacterium]|nr:phosphoribosylglycinamide formyltransferase [Bacteroidales bacterium]
MTRNIVIFASGSGTNMQRIVEYFREKRIRTIKVFCNRPDALVLQRAENLGVPAVVFGKDDLYRSEAILSALQSLSPDLIVLAGFLWRIPENIIHAFAGKIINIHPALLPRYGGKGMYGEHVHRAVIEHGDTESGITVHYVNEQYDDGDIIFQAKCPVDRKDTPATLAQKIHALEYEHFPAVIERLLITGE